MSVWRLTSFLLVSFLGFVSNANGQSLNLEQKAKEQFDKSVKLIWVKQFKGRFNDYNDIAISLACDGLYVKGVWQFIKSREYFTLEGTLEGKSLILDEKDEQGRITGFIKGQLSGNEFKGTWTKLDKSFGVPVIWKISEKQNLIPSYCGENKWINRYTGIFESENLELTLQKVHGSLIIGKLYIESLGETFLAKGDLNAEGKTFLQIVNARNEPNGSLLLDLENQVSIPTVWKSPKGKSFSGVFDLSNRLIIGCLEYADYYGVCDIMYPKTNQSGFNRKMEEESEIFASSCRNYFKKKNEELARDPDLRLEYRASGWFETEFFNRNIISGIQEYRASWEQKPKLVSVNYDLVNDKEILFHDIFREEYELEYFVKNVILKEMEKHPYFQQDEAFRAWIKGAEFPFFTIRREGIYFSTAFNSVYGRQGITIPFSKLKSFLKKDASWSKGFY
jgi:hypothetical protein